MNRVLMCLGLAPVLAAGLGCKSQGEKNLDALIAKAVAAYGGEQALAKASHLRETGLVTSLMRNGEKGTIQRLFSRPDKLKVDIAYSASHEVRIWDGRAGWREGAPAQGPQLDAMVLQAARLALPWNLQQHRSQLVDHGMVNVDGQDLHELELPLGNGLSLTVDVDPGSGRILRSSGKGGPLPMGGQMRFVTSYGDFRQVEGVLVPFREENYANGFTTGETVLEQVEFLSAQPSGAFQP